MLTEDHLIRMINIALSALLRIIGLKKEGDLWEAQQLIDLTFEQLLGLRASMAKNLDDERLYFLLTRNDQLDTVRLRIIAELFRQEGEILSATGRAAEGREDSTRALRYFLEVYFQDEQQDRSELILRISELVQALDPATLGASALWPLAGFYEEEGAFARAESILLLLAGRPDLQESIRPELDAFYRRMLAKPAGELARGGLTPERLREKLSQRGG